MRGESFITNFISSYHIYSDVEIASKKPDQDAQGPPSENLPPRPPQDDGKQDKRPPQPGGQQQNPPPPPAGNQQRPPRPGGPQGGRQPNPSQGQ